MMLCFFKGTTVLSSQLIWDSREYGKTSNFHEHDKMHFLGYEASLLIRSNAVWNTTVVDKALSKSWVVVFPEALCA